MSFGGHQNKCHVGKLKYWNGTSLTILKFYFAFMFPSKVKSNQVKVSKGAKIRNRYNQVSHLT